MIAVVVLTVLVWLLIGALVWTITLFKIREFRATQRYLSLVNEYIEMQGKWAASDLKLHDAIRKSTKETNS